MSSSTRDRAAARFSTLVLQLSGTSGRQPGEDHSEDPDEQQKLTAARAGKIRRELDDLFFHFGPAVVPEVHAPQLYARLGKRLDAERDKSTRAMLKAGRGALIEQFGSSIRKPTKMTRQHFTLSKPENPQSIVVLVLGGDGEPVWKQILPVKDLWSSRGRSWDRKRVAQRLRDLADRLDA